MITAFRWWMGKVARTGMGLKVKTRLGLAA